MDFPKHFSIFSSAPTRICDNGGWTDTWFSQHGQIFSIAIEPRAAVQILCTPRSSSRPQIQISALNYDLTYFRELGEDWEDHPLIEAAIDRVGIPEQFDVDIFLHSDAPPGASMGTSAAITVALIGALDCLTPGRLTAYEIAYEAHRVETEDLRLQSGIQDQLAAAFGGISFIDMVHYPHAIRSEVSISPDIWWELENRLLVVYMGTPHSSSEVHKQVITHLENAGPTEHRLENLRKTASAARNALSYGDFNALGLALSHNTECQRALHPDLVSPLAEKLIKVAQTAHVLGWKVNGAGGSGGSISFLLDGDLKNRFKLEAALQSSCPECQTIRPRLAQDGIRRHLFPTGSNL
ncbi:MAG: GHMP kinase [Chloroflexota bacterium]